MNIIDSIRKHLGALTSGLESVRAEHAALAAKINEKEHEARLLGNRPRDREGFTDALMAPMIARREKLAAELQAFVSDRAALPAAGTFDAQISATKPPIQERDEAHTKAQEIAAIDAAMAVLRDSIKATKWPANAMKASEREAAQQALQDEVADLRRQAEALAHELVAAGIVLDPNAGHWVPVGSTQPMPGRLHR